MEKGADAVQEVDAGLILSPSLFEPWAEALRAKSSSIVGGLRRVLPDGEATEGAVLLLKIFTSSLLARCLAGGSL